MLTNIDVKRNKNGSTCWSQCVRSVDLAFGALKKNMCYGGKNNMLIMFIYICPLTFHEVIGLKLYLYFSMSVT